MKHNCITATLAVFVFILMGCNNEVKNTGATINGDSVEKSDGQVKSASITSAGCPTVIKSFLAWYKVHIQKLDSIQLVRPVKDSSGGQYRVDFDNAQKYINELRKSGFFSETYLRNMILGFKEKDKNLVKEKQNDGPAVGFESDFFLFTQEPEAVLDSVNSLKIVPVNDTVFKLLSFDNNILFGMEVRDGRCFIKDINFSLK